MRRASETAAKALGVGESARGSTSTPRAPWRYRETLFHANGGCGGVAAARGRGCPVLVRGRHLLPQPGHRGVSDTVRDRTVSEQGRRYADHVRRPGAAGRVVPRAHAARLVPQDEREHLLREIVDAVEASGPERRAHRADEPDDFGSPLGDVACCSWLHGAGRLGTLKARSAYRPQSVGGKRC